MNILISPLSQTPIYEQIKIQIRELILSGTLKSGEQLPSIRLMAKDLKVGIITVKRAYDDLCEEGITISAAGKGVYVADVDAERAKRIHLDMLYERLLEIKGFCEESNISKEDLDNLINKLYGGNNDGK
ncbi:MAG: GntR family transcriptional regulator [Bacillota bacterium]|nr:GntR family transcriptional regulator [Bacillota bacterium]